MHKLPVRWAAIWIVAIAVEGADCGGEGRQVLFDKGPESDVHVGGEFLKWDKISHQRISLKYVQRV